MSQDVLIIDDERSLRDSLSQTLELAEFDAFATEDPNLIVKMATFDWNGIIISDLRMPKMSGLALLAKILETDRDIPVIILTGHGDVPQAVEAMQMGAFNFLEKPCDPEQLIAIVKKALYQRRLVMKNRALQSRVSRLKYHTLIGESDATQRLIKNIERIGQNRLPVVIRGATGCNKERIARCIHESSNDNQEYRVVVFTEESEMNELMTHIPKQSSVFCDGVEFLSSGVQKHLAQLIEQNPSCRFIIGVALDFDLKTLQTELYYHFTNVELTVPPIIDRPEDIPLIFKSLTDDIAKEQGLSTRLIDNETLTMLSQHQWSGDMRELRAIAERWVLGIDLDLGTAVQNETPSLNVRVDQFEKNAILSELKRQNGSVTNTAKSLYTPRKTLYDKMKKYGISRNQVLD